MIKIIRSHIKNDVKQIKAAWDDMDTLSHVLVFYFIAVVIMAGDTIIQRIHWH